MKNKRIAIWTPGGIGGGDFNQGLPILMNMVRGLSTQFQLTVFSFASVEKSGIPNVNLISPPQWLPVSFLRWLYLIIAFLYSHLTSHFKIIYSFWGYPTGTIAVMLGKVLRIPSMVSVLGGELASLPSLNYGHLRKSSTRKLVKWTCQQATCLTVVSNYQAEILKQIGVNRTVEWIPFGSDTKLFVKKDKPFVNGILKILHVASITPVKDQNTLLKAFAILCEKQKAVLRMIGADQMNKKIHSLAKELGVEGHIEFIGAVTNAELTKHYDWADMFLLTSLSEGQNNSLTDAAQSGLLIVSTPVGAAFDIGRSGVLIVPFANPQSIAESILMVSGKPELWKNLTNHSSKWASDHNLDWSIDKLCSVCNKLIG